MGFEGFTTFREISADVGDAIELPSCLSKSSDPLAFKAGELPKKLTLPGNQSLSYWKIIYSFQVL